MRRHSRYEVAMIKDVIGWMGRRKTICGWLLPARSPKSSKHRQAGGRRDRGHGVRASADRPAPVRCRGRRRNFRYRLAFGAHRRHLRGTSANRSIERAGRPDRKSSFRGRPPSLPGSGRLESQASLDNVVVAWNGSRESARALAESLLHLLQARKVGILVVEGEQPTEADALKGMTPCFTSGITASMR
jgi:hypothetical protein